MEDPLMRQAWLRLLCEGRSKRKAAKAMGHSVRSVQRYLAREVNEDLAEKTELAVELGKSESPDPRAVEELVSSEGPSIPPMPELPPDPAVEVLEEAPDLPVVAELVEDSGGDSGGDGVPAFTVENLVAMSWRLLHTRGTPVTVHAVHARSLYQYVMARQRRATLMQLGTERGAAPSSERGLTREAVDRFRRAVIGPAPDDDDG